jgi:hypothetical protein
MAESIGPMCHSIFLPPVLSRFPAGRVPGYRTRRKEHALPIVHDEFRPAIPRSGCSPALPVSASPALAEYHAIPQASGKTRHFYFAERATFLLCLDSHRDGCGPNHLIAVMRLWPGADFWNGELRIHRRIGLWRPSNARTWPLLDRENDEDENSRSRGPETLVPFSDL